MTDGCTGMKTFAFISAHPLPLSPSPTHAVRIFHRHPSKRVRASPARLPLSQPIVPRLPSCCTDLPESQSPPPSSPPADDENGNLPFLRPPSRAPALLRRPESVLTVAGVALLAGAAYLSRSTRGATSRIVGRFQAYFRAAELTRLLRARRAQRVALEGTMQSTAGALARSEAMVDAQKQRAETGERRLDQLERQAEVLLSLQRRREALAEELAEREHDLAELEADVQRAEEEGKKEKGQVEIEIGGELQRLDVEIADAECRQTLGKQRDRKVRFMESVEDSVKKLRESEGDVRKRESCLGKDVDSIRGRVKESEGQIEELTRRIEEADQEILSKKKGIAEEKVKGTAEDLEELRSSVSSLNRRQRQLQGVIEDKDATERTISRRKKMLEDELQKADQRLEEMRQQVELLCTPSKEAVMQEDSANSDQSSERVAEINTSSVPHSEITEDNLEIAFPPVVPEESPAAAVPDVGLQPDELTLKIDQQRQQSLESAILDDGSSVTEAAQRKKNISTSSSSSKSSATSAKRPRATRSRKSGRSAVNVTETNESEESKVIDEAQVAKPKKRGRQKKKLSLEAEASSLPATADVAPSSDAAPVKRKRGRPKKNATTTAATGVTQPSSS